MGRTAQFLIISFVLLLVAGAFGAYALGAADRDVIAEGVRVGGVDVSGLAPAEAEAKISRDLVEPLSRPVEVEAGEKTTTLTAKRLRTRADLDGMVDEALDAGNEGGFYGRLERRITGDQLSVDLSPRVQYSEKAVDRFVKKMESNLSRKPVDARIEPSGAGLNKVAHQPGRKIDGKALAADIKTELEALAGTRRVRARITRVEPDVTVDDLASKHPTYITVDRAGTKLRFFRNLQLEKAYTISVGKAGHETPAGLYAITDKQTDPVWNVPNSEWAGKLAGRTIPPGPENPLKARWLGIYNGVGIHGTSSTGSLGSAQSHGCLRMAIPEVKELFERVPVQTPIYIS
ncbi:MAG: L,D-transpeptidase family protein [Solirubrobacterales bacterium]